MESAAVFVVRAEIYADAGSCNRHKCDGVEAWVAQIRMAWFARGGAGLRCCSASIRAYGNCKIVRQIHWKRQQDG